MCLSSLASHVSTRATGTLLRRASPVRVVDHRGRGWPSTSRASVREALLAVRRWLRLNPSGHGLVALCEAALGRTLLHPGRQSDFGTCRRVETRDAHIPLSVGRDDDHSPGCLILDRSPDQG